MLKIKIIRKVLTGAWLVLSLVACSQKKEEPMTNQNPEINAKNIVEKLQQEVKEYPKEYIYNINYRQNYCFFEVLVNDIPVFKRFDQALGASAFDANQAIFKSGIQKVTFRMYPSEDENNVLRDFFTKFAYINLSIDIYDNKDKNYTTSLLKQHKTPKIPNPVPGESPDSIFVATGKDYYEDSFTFEAQVPFLLQNFDKAQDLRKMDPKALEAKLLIKYKQVWDIYQNKDYDQIARISFDNLKNEAVSLYYSPEDIQEIWDRLTGVYKLNSFQMQPLENYELQFFAEGKLVAFTTKSQKYWARGNSALWAKFDRGDGEEFVFCNRYFYIPEGETEFKVY